MLLDSFRLAARIFEDGFKPDFLVGLWRGGSAVGIAVQEGLEYFGVKTDHIAVRTSYAGRDAYSRRVAGEDTIRVHGLQYLLERVITGHSMLIVDDVYSTGHSVAAVVNELATKARRNLPHDIRTATVWYRPTDRTEREPDYFVHRTDDWLVLPYEMSGISDAELQQHKPALAPILDELAAHLKKP
ncbi:MAG: phosphoribosyltransferase domain-containing protein [Gammaproteobacteria bacterium]|nr:phosphoribosyltransferase domain-containing protein [Gammaproteobacteria bacterium]NNF60413.1 hypoxanthine phosphoribosyltransferase [Gammaproteobacteria bacterium]